MSDAYWRYADSRQQPAVSSLVGKRPRSDYDVPSGREMAGYYSRDDDRAPHRAIRDTESINQSYDRYLRSGQLPYAGADSGRLPGSGMSGHPADDPRMAGDPRMGSDPRMAGDPRMVSDPRMGADPRLSSGVMDPVMPVKGRGSNLGSGRPDVPLPPDASSTLFVEGLPANCTRREVAHIFRPFVGYKEVRLVTKESRHSGGDPLVLCFVDFVSPPHAATAMDALQEMRWSVKTESLPKGESSRLSILVYKRWPLLGLGGYKFDENDRDSAILRLQFARYPGARSGGGHRGKR